MENFGYHQELTFRFQFHRTFSEFEVIEKTENDERGNEESWSEGIQSYKKWG